MKTNNLIELKVEIIDFFNKSNEYETRTYLRDCIDIVHFKRKELESYYPKMAFTFLRTARIAYDNLNNDEFYHYINEQSCQCEGELFRWILRATKEGIAKLVLFENELNYKKWLKTQNEEITA